MPEYLTEMFAYETYYTHESVNKMRDEMIGKPVTSESGKVIGKIIDVTPKFNKKDNTYEFEATLKMNNGDIFKTMWQFKTK